MNRTAMPPMRPASNRDSENEERREKGEPTRDRGMKTDDLMEPLIRMAAAQAAKSRATKGRDC